jgi:hypothetical protein
MLKQRVVQKIVNDQDARFSAVPSLLHSALLYSLQHQIPDIQSFNYV